MWRLFAAFYYLRRGKPSTYTDNMPLIKHVQKLRKSGYTKTIFDCDGHTIVIQSHKHVEDNRA